MSIYSRPWRRLDVEQFRSALSSSRLCQPDRWPADIDAMASLCHEELKVLLDQSLPVRQFLRRQRSSDPWFDSECRQAKRLTRRLERASTIVVSRWTANFTADRPTSAVAELPLPRRLSMSSDVHVYIGSYQPTTPEEFRVLVQQAGD